MSAPANASTVSGSAVIVSATASDNVGLAGVQFKLDGANLGAEDTSAPYSMSWNTTQVSGGSHSLTAVARDTSNNTTTSSPVAVTVSNPSAFDFSLSTGGAQSVARGSSVTNTITATLASGTAQSVTYSVSGLPSGATSSVTPGSCSPTCSATVTIQTAASTPLATSTITVTGTAGSVVSRHFRPDCHVVIVRHPVPSWLALDEDRHNGERRFGEQQQQDAQNGPAWTTGKSGRALTSIAATTRCSSRTP
jgi:VCBS repeat-containing protein